MQSVNTINFHSYMSKSRQKKSIKLQKAYNNLDFLNSPSARTIRVLTEMVEPAERLRKQHIRNTVVMFGSARTLPKAIALKNLQTVEKSIKFNRKVTKKVKAALERAQHDLVMSKYYEDAANLSFKLTKWFNESVNKDKRFVVCSGGGPGIMEAANLGAKKAKGKSIGLNINLPMEQYPNLYQTEEISFEFHYFFIRKFWFFYLAKALIVFPGGYGTLDELFELLTLIQTGKSKKYMPVLLFGQDFWEELINFKALTKWGVVDESDLKMFHVFSDVESSFQFIKKELSKHYSLR